MFAVPGATSSGLVTQVGQALSWRPDLAVVVIGANDLTHLLPVEVAAQALGEAVRRLRAGGTEVVVAPAPDLSAVPHVPVFLRETVRAAGDLLRDRQKSAVLAEGGRIADPDQRASRAFATDPSLFSTDRFHPSSAGYAVIADSLLPALMEASRASKPAQPEQRRRWVSCGSDGWFSICVVDYPACLGCCHGRRPERILWDARGDRARSGHGSRAEVRAMAGTPRDKARPEPGQGPEDGTEIPGDPTGNRAALRADHATLGPGLNDVPRTYLWMTAMPLRAGQLRNPWQASRTRRHGPSPPGAPRPRGAWRYSEGDLVLRVTYPDGSTETPSALVARSSHRLAVVLWSVAGSFCALMAWAASQPPPDGDVVAAWMLAVVASALSRGGMAVRITSATGDRAGHRDHGLPQPTSHPLAVPARRHLGHGRARRNPGTSTRATRPPDEARRDSSSGRPCGGRGGRGDGRRTRSHWLAALRQNSPAGHARPVLGTATTTVRHPGLLAQAPPTRVNPPGGAARARAGLSRGEEGQMDQLDHAHIASGSGQRRGRRGIGQVRFGTVLVVVPAVVQSHPASVAQAPRLTGPRDPRHRSCRDECSFRRGAGPRADAWGGIYQEAAGC